MRLLLLFLLVLLAGCSAFRAPLTAPDKGGPPWIELTSPHFALKTDLDSRTAHQIVASLEQSHAALAFALRRPARANDTILEVVVFERRGDFYEIAGQERTAGAYFTTGLPIDVTPHPAIVMFDSERVEERRMTVQHELAHRFLHERFPRIPRWLDEGMAEYHSSARVDGTRLVLGAPASIDFTDRTYFWVADMGSFEQLQVPRYLAPSLRDLTEAGRAEFYTKGGVEGVSLKDRERQGALYTAAWKLVHLLLNGPDPTQRAAFAAYLGDLERGANPREAFLERFGYDWSGLERAYRAYLAQERPMRAVFDLPASSGEPAVVERALSARDVHLLWARLMSGKKHGVKRVPEELSAALAAEPGAPEVLLRRGMFLVRQGDLAGAKRDFDAVLAKTPEAPRALLSQVVWYEAQEAKAGGEERGCGGTPAPILERLVRTASRAQELRVAAKCVLLGGRTDEALGLASRSIRADPLCWSCQYAYSRALVGKGRIEEALAALERAVTLAPEDAEIAAVLESSRRKLEKMRSDKPR